MVIFKDIRITPNILGYFKDLEFLTRPIYSAVRVSSTFILVNKVNKKAKHLKKRIIITNRLKINLQINQFDIKKKKKI